MSRRLDVAFFAALALMWGLSFPAISVGLAFLPPLLFAGLRYGVAAALLLGYAVFRVDDWRPAGRDDLVAVVGGGIFLIAGNGMLFVGQQTVASGVAALLQALVPIATALWALLLLDERLSTLGAVGVGLGFLGIGFIVQPDPANLLAGDTAGRLLVVGQVISVSLGGVVIQRADPTLGRASLSGWSMIVGAGALFLGSVVMGEIPGPEATAATAIAAVLYLGVFSTAIAFVIFFTILEERGAFEASLVGYLVPVVATVVGVFVLDETIGPLTLVGFALVAAGFALLKREALVDLTGLATGGP